MVRASVSAVAQLGGRRHAARRRRPDGRARSAAIGRNPAPRARRPAGRRYGRPRTAAAGGRHVAPGARESRRLTEGSDVLQRPAHACRGQRERRRLRHPASGRPAPGVRAWHRRRTRRIAAGCRPPPRHRAGREWRRCPDSAATARPCAGRAPSPAAGPDGAHRRPPVPPPAARAGRLAGPAVEADAHHRQPWRLDLIGVDAAHTAHPI